MPLGNVTLYSFGNNGSGTNLVSSNTFNCVVGERISVQATCGSSNATVITGVIDSGGNTYAAVGTEIVQGGGPIASKTFECASATSAITNGNITMGFGVSVSARSGRVVRSTGTTSAAFLSQGRATANSSSLNSGAVSPANYTQPNAVIGFGFIGGSGLSVTADTGAGFTNGGAFTSADSAISTFSRFEYKDTTGTSGATATFTSGASDLWIAHCHILPEAAASNVTIPWPFFRGLKVLCDIVEENLTIPPLEIA